MFNFLNMCTYLENTLINISNARFTVNKHAFFLLVGGGGREYEMLMVLCLPTVLLSYCLHLLIHLTELIWGILVVYSQGVPCQGCEVSLLIVIQ
jgi:hypothetical protein